ncbi:MAG: hypothetical protein HY583_02200 [Candidatus Omnitrophica bacterium]|nr:hypothetical protein [Candidatus Omnitrophota bacterium]
MKLDKRLKRGLADLSPLFADSSGLIPDKRRSATFTIEPPEEDTPLIFTQFICASFLNSRGNLEPSDLIRLLEGVKASFQETYLLSVAPMKGHYEAFNEAADRIPFKHIPFDQFEAMAQPKMISLPSNYSASSKKAMMVLDSFPFSAPGTNFLELLDHGIFIVQAGLNQLQSAYELMKFCLMRNPALRCSILLTGSNSKNIWELIYERLSVMASQFLGCDLGFLGWCAGEDFELNSDLLLEESPSLKQLPFKRHFLSSGISEAVLSESKRGIEENQTSIDLTQPFRQDLSIPEFIALNRLSIELRSQHS